jgi:Na+-transporting NADH:ubiquinone oxidoreductase subunit NqrB
MIFAILLASLFSPLIDYVVVQANIRRRRRRLQETANA